MPARTRTHTHAHLSASNRYHCRVQISWICTVEKQIFLKHLLFCGWYWSQSTSLPKKCTLMNFYSFSLNGIIQFGHILFAQLILAVFQSQMHMQRRNDSPLFRVLRKGAQLGCEGLKLQRWGLSNRGLGGKSVGWLFPMDQGIFVLAGCLEISPVVLGLYLQSRVRSSRCKGAAPQKTERSEITRSWWGILRRLVQWDPLSTWTGRHWLGGEVPWGLYSPVAGNLRTRSVRNC